jgi:hypothetical protein
VGDLIAGRSQVFLLSPAHCRGRRAGYVLSPRSEHPVALRLRSKPGAPLGEVFSFLSGLYFRGKLVYARRIAAPPPRSHGLDAGGVYVITPNAGLRSPDAPITVATVEAFARVDLDPGNAAYRRPLERSAVALADLIGQECQVVLLGSIASPKYVDVLQGILGERLRFPLEFVGRGDMSRGGLLLGRAAEGVELTYVPVAGAARHGPRPPRLPPPS